MATVIGTTQSVTATMAIDTRSPGRPTSMGLPRTCYHPRRKALALTAERHPDAASQNIDDPL
jgi:hypothetical protein